jgi:hypothetical protein
MSARLEDMACIDGPDVGESLAAPPAANFERSEACRHVQEGHRLDEAAASALIQDGVMEHESMCADIGADIDALARGRGTHQSIAYAKATPSRIGAAKWHGGGSVQPDTSRRVVPQGRGRIVGGNFSWQRLINDLPRGQVERDALCGYRRNETAGKTSDEA